MSKNATRSPVENAATKPAREMRSVDLDGCAVPYTLKRYRGRSSVGLIVDHRGLTVTAPRRVSDRYVIDAIRQQADWVLQKLQEWRAKTPAQMRWRDGLVIPFLGEPVTVMRDLFHSGAPQLDGSVLRLCAAHDGEDMQRHIVSWYRAQATQFFAPRVAQCCQRFALPQPRLLVSNAETRWGSCNVKREVRLSWRLMKAPERVIDYVIAHELAHLRHLDHSARFWALVAQMYPTYKVAQALLRRDDALYRAF